MNLLKYEKTYWNKGIKLVAGVDEAGRGPLAGPVVAASVIINDEFDLTDINDSKKLSPKKREKLYHKIIQNAIDVSIGIAHEYEIDIINILNATFLAMKRAVDNMKTRPEQLLIDGPHSDIKFISVENIISGDSKSASIAAASIIAKVTRDTIMKEYDKIYTHYNFKQHKGYGTKLLEIILSDKIKILVLFFLTALSAFLAICVSLLFTSLRLSSLLNNN